MKYFTENETRCNGMGRCFTVVDTWAGVLEASRVAKPALGRGLGALLGGSSPVTKPAAESPRTPAAPAPPQGEAVRKIPVAKIRACSFQPRKDFADEAIKELADSIKQQGVLTPILVRAAGEGFELIAGERRWRAAQVAGLTEIPALVREADDRKVLELALIENLQREDLNAIEEALGYAELAERFKLTQEEIAARMGKARSAVANSLRLLNLSDEVRGYVRKGLLSVGHAKLLLGLSNSAEQDQLAREVLANGLSVRALEDLIATRRVPAPVVGGSQTTTSGSSAATNGKPGFTPDLHITALRDRLQQKLGSKVLVRYRKGKGAIEVRFFSDDDLDRILAALGVSMD